MQQTLEEYEIRSEWYRRISDKLQPFTEGQDKRIAKKYKLDLLLRIAARIDSFAGICEECQNSKQEIAAFVEGIGNTIQFRDKEKLKELSKKLDDLTKHLKEKHKLVKKGHYIGTLSSIGLATGMGSGFAIDGLQFLSFVLPVAFVIIGFILDRKAKKENRVI